MLALLAAPLAGCGGADGADPVRAVVVGDSLTAGIEPGGSADHPGDSSWVPAADRAPLDVTGGWAVPGATSVAMRDRVGDLDGDVLVLLAGTNDVLQGVPWATTRDALREVVATVDVPRTVLLAIPPLDLRPAEALDLNQRAAELALEEGWAFLDPWTEVTVGGRFAPGATTDGVHPSPEAAALAGEAVRTALLDRADA